MVWLFYTTYISVDLAHHEIFCAKVGKGGVNHLSWCSNLYLLSDCKNHLKILLGLIRLVHSFANIIIYSTKMLRNS